MRGWMQCAESAVSIADCCAAARKLTLFRSLFDISGCCAGLPPRPAQGLTPPLHSRKGFHPLAPFRWRDSLGLVQSAVSIADCCAAARKLACFLSLFIVPMCCAGLPPGPAQGLSPPLHPRKEFHPLTRFRWRDSLQLNEFAVSIAGCGASRPETHVFSFSFFAFSRCARAAARTCAGAIAAPAPAQGVSPLDPFSLARSLGVARNRGVPPLERTPLVCSLVSCPGRPCAPRRCAAARTPCPPW